MERQHCCSMMTSNVNHRCDQHPPYECPDYLIGYYKRSREYSILIHDGEDGAASSGIIIQFCPWCGRPLPTIVEDAGADDSSDEPWVQGLAE